MFDNCDDAKSAERGERVGYDIVEKRGQALLRVRHQREQYVARVGNRRVGKQPPHAALHDGDKIAHQHGESGNDGKHSGPSGNQVQPASAAFGSGKADCQ